MSRNLDFMPQYRHQQLEVLAQMFGDAPALPVCEVTEPSPRDRYEYLALPGAIETTPSGGIAWRPGQWPATLTSVATGDSTELAILIDHYAIDRKVNARAAGRIAAIRFDVERLSDKVGIFLVPIIVPPKAWSVASIRSLIDRVLPLIPIDGRDCAHGDAKIDVEWDGGVHRRSGVPYSVITITPTYTGGFYAEIAVEREATSAILEWNELFGRHSAGSRSVLALRTIDEWLARGRPGSPSTPTPQMPAGEDSSEDSDDDLDAIEKAARVALHGKKAIPPSSQSTKPAVRDTYADCIMGVIELFKRGDDSALKVVREMLKTISQWRP
jgi:hypothetical protein